MHHRKHVQKFQKNAKNTPEIDLIITVGWKYRLILWLAGCVLVGTAPAAF